MADERTDGRGLTGECCEPPTENWERLDPRLFCAPPRTLPAVAPGYPLPWPAWPPWLAFWAGWSCPCWRASPKKFASSPGSKLEVRRSGIWVCWLARCGGELYGDG